MSTEIACLESSHHFTVIEMESLDLHRPWFRREKKLSEKKCKVMKNKMAPEKWMHHEPECIINTIAEKLSG